MTTFKNILKAFVLAMLGVVLVIVAIFGIGVLVGKYSIGGNDSAKAEIGPWFDQDGHAIVGDRTTPRFTEWLISYFKGEGYTVTDMGGWFQAVKKDAPTASWGEWGDSITLKDVEGVSENKALWVSMRDIHEWVYDSNVTHVTCSGSFISSYNENSMGAWLVENSTIVQFDGDKNAISKIVEKFANEWADVREDYEGCVAK